jgi:hypothetical protein
LWRAEGSDETQARGEPEPANWSLPPLPNGDDSVGRLGGDPALRDAQHLTGLIGLVEHEHQAELMLARSRVRVANYDAVERRLVGVWHHARGDMHHR